MPGVKKPVNSWMNWKACSDWPSRGRAVSDGDDDRRDRGDAADEHQLLLAARLGGRGLVDLGMGDLALLGRRVGSRRNLA